jgi:predicted porin
MNVRYAVVAAAAILASLPASAADFNVGPDTKFSISGFLAVGIKNSSIDNSSRPGLKNETRIDDNTSRIIVSGSTKIADGYYALFQIGSRFTTDVRPGDQVLNGNPLTVSQASGWADDDTFAGILGPFGRIIVGKNSFYWSDTIALPHLSQALDGPGESYRVWDVQGLSTFTILDQAQTITKTNAFVNVYTLGITRSRNVIRWDSPNFGGADFALAYTKNAVGGELWYPGGPTPGVVNGVTYDRSYEDGQTVYARARYNKDGITLHFSYLDQKLQGGVYNPVAYNGPLDTTAFRLGASYKFPFGLKAGVVYDSTTLANGVAGGVAIGASQGDAKRDAFEIPLSYTMGDHMFHLTYAKAGDVSSASNSGAHQFNVAWDYALNKKTFVSLEYTKLKNDSNGHYVPFLTNFSFGPSANTGLGEGYTQVQAGLQFWF